MIGLKENTGFLTGLKTLNLSRPAVAISAVGLAQGAFDAAIQYSREREQFGVKIGTFQAIQHLLADMAMRIEASRLSQPRQFKSSAVTGIQKNIQ